MKKLIALSLIMASLSAFAEDTVPGTCGEPVEAPEPVDIDVSMYDESYTEVDYSKFYIDLTKIYGDASYLAKEDS